ncbi:MAG: glutamate 5-kinase [Candidatus Sumerlaeia bacterium]|nr:glutamate 5-kinase [Candidatus Sumerlaeia bacterium]
MIPAEKHPATDSCFHRLDLPKGIVVLKAGSAVLSDAKGNPDPSALDRIANLSAAWMEKGRPVVVVSSGAIATGRGILGWTRRPRLLPEKQALAATGQSHLMFSWIRAFGRYNRQVAQILLTREDMDDRRRYLNARYTVEKLIEWGVVPIINENDTTAVEEIEFGDNDILAAMVAVKLQARLLLILTTVDGLMAFGDGKGGTPRLIGRVERVTAEIESLVHGDVSLLGRGGMSSKIKAARIATRAGIPAILAHGRNASVFEQLHQDCVRGTLFVPQTGRRLSRREHWMLSARAGRSRRLIVDDGARRALIEGKKSLLPAGIVQVQGRFSPGDVVDIADLTGRVFACGLANYDSDDMNRIRGLRSSQIAAVLGRKPYDEAVHRDNLVVL